MSLNLWGRRGAWVKRRAVLRSGLRALHPDLVSFQEAIKTDEYDMVADLLGSEYHIVYQRHPESDGQSAVIASRWPLEKVDEIDQRVSGRIDSAVTTLVAELSLPAPFGPLLFVNHLPSWQLNYEYERELQSLAAARRIEELVSERDLHVVVAGDLTDPPDSVSVRLLDGASIAVRSQRLLSRRLGLAFSAPRLRARALRRPRRSHARHKEV